MDISLAKIEGGRRLNSFFRLKLNATSDVTYVMLSFYNVVE